MSLPYQLIKTLVEGQSPAVSGTIAITDRQLQPSSIDLTLGQRVYRISSSFLPRETETVDDLLRTRTLYDFELRDGSILETNTSYIIPLNERLSLPQHLYGIASPKSSIGRVDVFVRVLTDHNPQYDYIPAGYSGPLYLEIIPLTFAIKVGPGLAMTQMRLRDVSEVFPTSDELRDAHRQYGLMLDEFGERIPENQLRVKGNVLSFTVDLTSHATVGYRARHYVNELLDLTKIGAHDVERFWTPVERQASGELILEPNSFYIIATKERVRIPPMFAAEITPYDPSTGELRSHYAGFFDPGFGYGSNGEMPGNIVVLEVRAHSTPFRLTDGQVICKMMFERVSEVPERLYGAGIGSTYTDARIRLSKYFKKA